MAAESEQKPSVCPPIGGYSVWPSAARAIERHVPWKERRAAMRSQEDVDRLVEEIERAVDQRRDEEAVALFWLLVCSRKEERYESAAYILSAVDEDRKLHWSKMAAWWSMTATRRDRSSRRAARCQ